LLEEQRVGFSTDELRYNLFGVRVALRNVTVRSPDAPDLPPIAHIDRLNIQLSRTGLLRGRYVLQSGTAEGLTVHYVVDERGRDNLPRPPHDVDQPSKPLDYLIEDLRLTNGLVRYQDRAKGIDVDVPISAVEISGNALTDRHVVRAQAANGTLVLQDRRAALETLDATLDIGEDDVRVTRIDLVTEGAHVDMMGTLSALSDPRADLAVRGTVDAARAAVLAGLRDRTAGTVAFEGQVKGRLAAPTIDAHLNASDLAFRDLSALQIETSGTYDVARNLATLSDLRLDAPIGRVTGNGVLALSDGDTSHLTVNASALDAAALMRAFELPYALASRVDAQVQAEWPGMDYARASGNGTVHLTATAARGRRGVIPAGGRVDLTGDGHRTNVVLTRLRAGGIEMNGRAQLFDRRRIDGTARVRIANVSQSVATAETVLGHQTGSLLPIRVGGGLNAVARLTGTVSAPTISADVSSAGLTLGATSGLEVDSTLVYTPSLVTVRELNVQWQDARADAHGTIGLGNPGRLDITFSAEALELSEVCRALDSGDVPASGTINVRGVVAGTMARPGVSATIEGANLGAYNEQWGTLAANVTLAKQVISVTDLLLQKPSGGRLSGTTSYDLDRHTYTADLRSENLELESLTLPGDHQLRGTLRFTARGEGSLDQPAGMLTLAADDLRVDEYTVGKVDAEAVVANHSATIQAAAPAYGVNVNGVVGTQQPYPATAQIRVDDLRLTTLPLNLPAPLEGQVRAAVDVAATLGGEGELAESLEATARIEPFTGAWNGQPFSLEAPSLLRYRSQRLAIDSLQVSARDSTASLTGELPLTDQGAPGALTVDAKANLATLSQYAPAEMKLTASGTLELAGVVRGSLKAVDPELTLTIADGAVRTEQLQPGFSNVALQTQVASGEARIEQLGANWGGARLTATGRVPFEALPELPVAIPRRRGPTSFQVAVEGLNVAELPNAPEGLSGRLSVDAKGTATRADLAGLAGSITFPELQLSLAGLTLGQEAPSTIVLADGVARIERLQLSGSVGTLSASGTMALTGDRAINVDANGKLNVAALSVLTEAVRAEGDATLKIAARGTTSSPELDGFVELSDSTFLVDDPAIAAESVNARLEMSGRRISLTTLTGSLNGGTLKGNGFVDLGEGGIADAALDLAADDVALDVPLDVRSLSDARVRLSKRDEEFVLDGHVTVEEAGLTSDINIDEMLIAATRHRRRLDLTERRNQFLERVRFNLDIDSAAPITIDNNLARGELTADLRLLGSPYEPGLSGQLTILEESTLLLNERSYQVERGTINFIGERQILPSVDLLLNTTASNYDVTVAITGTAGKTETTLTSEPTLPEPDIMALLVTGRTLEEMRGSEFEIAQEQALSFLAGRVGSQLGHGLEKATGFSSVRIEPQLIANETEPSARLTVGQEITNQVELVYSTNLTDSSDQIWVVDYDVTRRFQARALRQSDNSYRFDVNHDVRIGGRPAPRREPRQRPTIAAVHVTGDGRVPDEELRRRFDIEAGEKYDFFKIRKAIEHVEKTLEELGRLQGRVRLQRDGDAAEVAVTLRVVAGPQVDITFSGATPPSKIINEVRSRWRRGVFDNQRLDDSIKVLRGWLMQDNYLQPEIKGVIEDAGEDHRRVRFTVNTGPRYDTVILAFEGARGISPDGLDNIIETQKLERQLFTNPNQVTALLGRYYQEQGFLVAELDAPKYQFQGSQARVVVTVREGPRFHVGEVSVAGNAAVAADLLLVDLPVQPNDPFLAFAAENALSHLRDVYWRRGYNDVRLDYTLALDRGTGSVDVRFDIVEGPQSVIADITLQGNDKTSERLVREQLELQPSAPLDLGGLARSRKNLYDTRAFSVVDITREEGESEGSEKPVHLNVSVREVQPVQLRYGVSYDTERGLGGVINISNHNSLGKARVVGVQSRYDGENREVNAYLTQPSLRYFPIETTGSVYYRFERDLAIDSSLARFDIERRGLAIQQERKLSTSNVWSWGYRYERADLTDLRLRGTFTETITVSPLTTTFTHETRDDVLDASRGSFWSHGFGYSPSWLGADREYIKYFGQYFHTIPLQRERRRQFTNEILRPRFVYALAVRVGLARGVGEVVPRSERFFAGGSTTLRGFAEDAVGPLDVDGVPLGGSAMLLINNELRMPLVGMFDAVVFSDMGNVFPRVSDFSLSELRETAGVGLRARTRWFLLRGDYGFVLDPRAGERRSRFYFSLGQAF
jgi:outer membrane protein assembly complex protein YaeT